MGLIRFLKRLLFGRVDSPDDSMSSAQTGEAADARQGSRSSTSSAQGSARSDRSRSTGARPRPPRTNIPRLRYETTLVPTPRSQELCDSKPYAFAVVGPLTGQYLDLSTDSDPRWLDYYGLPNLATPADLADWLEMPLGRLAWLTWRGQEGWKPPSEEKAHYVYTWKKKKSGGWRLIESPKPHLKAAQTKILREILDRVPAHPAAHGFVRGRSIVTNAAPHVGQRVLLKIDLENFYTSVRYSRVVAIYRSLGFSREVAIWLTRLTTAVVPWNLASPDGRTSVITPYLSHHLPQGAPTSPALANLSAFALDVRMTGLARKYHLVYTRYADDLTFSGSSRTIPALAEIVPLTTRIIRSQRFRVHRSKRKFQRSSQQQSVTGIVVNSHLNVARRDFDRLKATLHNCVKHGPSQQNRDDRPDFAAHLRGRVMHVMQINPNRGEKLLRLYDQIDWTR